MADKASGKRGSGGDRRGQGDRANRGRASHRGSGGPRPSGKASRRGGQRSNGRGRTGSTSDRTRSGQGRGSGRRDPAQSGRGARSGESGGPTGRGSQDRSRKDSDASRSTREPTRSDHRKHGGRHGRESQARSGQRRTFSVDGGSSNLPKWLREEIQRVTPKDRQDATIELLADAAGDFADEQFGAAHRKLLKAKSMSTRASAIRELLGLTAYRLEHWEEALRELRAFRRFTGDTTHMPVELDSLRGLGRNRDVEKTWELFMELGGHPATDAEARVVYGSFLLDGGRAREAWNVTRPARTSKDSKPNERRRWFVAAKAALALGDADTAMTLVSAAREGDPDMPGLAELTDQIAQAQQS